MDKVDQEYMEADMEGMEVMEDMEDVTKSPVTENSFSYNWVQIKKNRFVNKQIV